MNETWEDFGGWQVDGVWYRHLTDAELECAPAETSGYDAGLGWVAVFPGKNVSRLDRQWFRIPADQGVGIGYRLPTAKERAEGLPDGAEHFSGGGWHPRGDAEMLPGRRSTKYRIPLPRVTEPPVYTGLGGIHRAEQIRCSNCGGPCDEDEQIDSGDYTFCSQECFETFVMECDCGHHTIGPGADPYAAHREWVSLLKGCCEHADLTPATETARGIGASREQPEILVQLQDWEGDGI